MAKWLVMWKMTQEYWSLPDATRFKILEDAMKTVKADMDSGFVKDWGIKADNSGGYIIYEGTETRCVEACMRYAKYLSSEGTPVISLTQFSEVFKKRTAEIRK